MVDEGFDIVTGGTDNHLMLVDLRPKKLTGDVAEKSLDRAGITCNKTGIPFDPEKPTVTSGIRLGTPAATTRGSGVAAFKPVGAFIGRVLGGLATHAEGNGPEGKGGLEPEVRGEGEPACRACALHPAQAT